VDFVFVPGHSVNVGGAPDVRWKIVFASSLSESGGSRSSLRTFSSRDRRRTRGRTAAMIPPFKTTRMVINCNTSNERERERERERTTVYDVMVGRFGCDGWSLRSCLLVIWLVNGG
jgi:hypothetical protein